MGKGALARRGLAGSARQGDARVAERQGGKSALALGEAALAGRTRQGDRLNGLLIWQNKQKGNMLMGLLIEKSQC